MGSFERWFLIRDGYLWEISETDGPMALRKGIERWEERLCTVEEAKIKHPKELLLAENYDEKRHGDH
jgi:hypothetical protein